MNEQREAITIVMTIVMEAIPMTVVNEQRETPLLSPNKAIKVLPNF